MSSRFAQLLAERKLVRAKISEKMVLKEIHGAQTDLADAQDSFKQKKFKWATIQGYYSMFHSARALLYHRSFREKSHYAISIALKELFSKELGIDLITKFEEGMELRQQADYGLDFSIEGATETIQGAEEFLRKAKEILRVQ